MLNDCTLFQYLADIMQLCIILQLTLCVYIARCSPFNRVKRQGLLQRFVPGLPDFGDIGRGTGTGVDVPPLSGNQHITYLRKYPFI